MTIIQKIIINFKKKLNNFAFPNIKTYQFQKFSPIILDGVSWRQKRLQVSTFSRDTANVAGRTLKSQPEGDYKENTFSFSEFVYNFSTTDNRVFIKG